MNETFFKLSGQIDKEICVTGVDVDEKRLILQAQQGDTFAFEALVAQHAQYVYNLALRVLQNPQEAEEVSQEAFIRVWRALPYFRVDSRFKTWLYKIVVNLCYDQLPKMKKELAALSPDPDWALPDKQPQPEQMLLTAELMDQLHQEIEQLPESYRLLIHLRHLQGLSYQEIAEVTGQPLGTVKTGIFRARKQLAKRIKDDER